jgi:hypothetical protein
MTLGSLGRVVDGEKTLRWAAGGIIDTSPWPFIFSEDLGGCGRLPKIHE